MLVCTAMIEQLHNKSVNSTHLRFAPMRELHWCYGASESLLSTQSGHSISPVQQSDSVKIVLRDKR